MLKINTVMSTVIPYYTECDLLVIAEFVILQRIVVIVEGRHCRLTAFSDINICDPIYPLSDV